MIEERIKRIIQDTRMNRLEWNREDENKLVTTVELPGENGGNTERVPVSLKRTNPKIEGVEISKGYFICVGSEHRTDSYEPVKGFGIYMFAD